MVLYQRPMGLRDATYPRWGESINKALGGAESTLAGIWEKSFSKIEAHSGMAERLVRDLEIEEALQEEIKDKLEGNNQSCGEWCALTDNEKKQG